MSEHTRTLYRPVGLKEMELILDADARAFPPRLPEQPYFYPVLNFEYAEQIACDWNTKDPKSGFAGFVTEFEVDKDYARQFKEHTVGASMHRELWVSAEELDEFNQHIQGRIEIRTAYYGDGYKGIKHWYLDLFAEDLFIHLRKTSLYSGQDFSGETTLNRNAIQLNFKYWIEHDFSPSLSEQDKTDFLQLILHIWRIKFPDVRLVGSELIE